MPATNSPPTLQRCLDALRSALEPPDEIVVVELPAHTGPAAARNLGVARSTAELVAFVDADVVVAGDAFVRIRDHFARDPRLTAVFGAYDDVVATDRLAARFRNLLHHHVHARASGDASTFWAGIGAIRREAFEQIGGFDEQRYPRPSIEDIELGTRLADHGARIVLDPAIRGTHLKNWSVAQMIRTDFSRRAVPWIHLLLERRELPRTLNLGWRERASAIAAVAAVVALARRRPVGVAVSAGALIPLNHPFYALLVRRLGPRAAAGCVPLHLAHHLVAVAAVPVGAITYVVDQRLGSTASTGSTG